MPRCWLNAATIALAIVGTASARVAPSAPRGFDPASPPPTLGLNSYAGHCVGTIREELLDLADRESGADSLRQDILRASMNVRRLAIELLEQGDRAGADGSLAVVIGYRLFRGREELDHALNGLVPLGHGLESGSGGPDNDLENRFNDATVALRRFNERALVLPADLPVSDPAALDRIVASLISGLIPAVRLATLGPIVNHWIPAAATTPTPAMIAAGLDQRRTSSRRNTQTLGQIGARLATAPIREDTRDEIAAIVTLLQRGEAFAELRPSIAAYRSLLSRTLDFAEAVAGADWLDQAFKDVFQDQLYDAVALFKDKQTRERGQARLERLVTLSTIINRASSLAPRRIDVRPIGAILAVLVQPIEEPGDAAPAYPGTILAVLRRMIDYRELDTPQIPRALRIVRRKLDDRYRAAERALFEQLQTFADNPEALTDPAVTTLLADQKQYLEDLQRIEELPSWIDTLSLLAPRSAGRVKAQIEKLSRWLLDPTRRPDAVLALDRLEQQLHLFYPLPFERRLRRADREVITATGARHEQLVQVIDKRRRQWAQAFAEGDDDSKAANRMLLLHRLTQTLADVVELLRLTGEAPALDRWSAWELGADSIARTVADLPARLKLATTAAIDQDDQSLRLQLERIDREAPLGKLAGRLGHILAEPLERLPDGAQAVLGQSVHPPTDDAWMVSRRTELANLCRYALEQQHAGSTGQVDLADALAIYVNTLAEELLADLGEPQSTRPDDAEFGQR